jgi:hypothetical protein
MTEFLWFLVGLFIGGIVTTLVLCCLQINRINESGQIFTVCSS